MTDRNVKVAGIAQSNHIILDGLRGNVVCQVGECLIEPGTILRTDDGTRSLTVDCRDKTVILRTPTNDTLRFKVLEHETWTAAVEMGTLRRRYPRLRGVHTVRSPRAVRVPDAMMPLAFQVDMNSLLFETPFSMILPAGYSFKAVPYTGIHIRVKSRAAPIGHVQGSEAAALECLREMVSEEEYRRYLVYGFILVTASSGRVYQVHRNQHYISVRENGAVVERVCVYIPDMSIPPTDKLVAFKTMIETDEERFKALGNVYRMETAA